MTEKNDHLSGLLAETKRVRGVFWGRTIEDLGPAALQLLVAVEVADRNGNATTASALADAIGIAPPAASTELRKLETGGYVKRVKGSSHHLSRDTKLTSAGSKVVRRVEQVAQAHET